MNTPFLGKGVHQVSGWWNEELGNRNMFLFSHLIEGCNGEEEEKITLIDTGSSIFPDGAIFPYMKSVDLDPRYISLILNTHGHGDHMGGNSRVKAVSGAKLAAHKLEVPNIETRGPSARALSGEGTKVDIILNDGDEIEISKGRKIKAILTPGHSPGSLSYYDIEEKVVFIGDSIGIGESGVHLPSYSDVDSYLKSIERIGSLELNYLLSGHYPPIRGINVPNVLKIHLRLIKDIHKSVLSALADLSKPSSILDITEIACNILDYPPLSRTVKAHLDKLVMEEKAKQLMKEHDTFWELI